MTELSTLPEADLVLVAVVGTTGLQPTLAAIAAGKDIALASKEVLVLAGKFVMSAARQHHVKLLPVDSEHNCQPDPKTWSWNWSVGSRAPCVDGECLTGEGIPLAERRSERVRKPATCPSVPPS